VRPIRTAGTLLALLLLVRCGAPGHPVRAPEGVTLAADDSTPAPVPEVAQAPRPSSVEEVPAPVARAEAEAEVPHLKEVRGLVHYLGMPKCGSNLLLDEMGQLLPGQEPYQVKALRELGEVVHAAYEVIWADPKSTWTEIAGVGIALSYTPAEPRRFVPFAIRRLTAPDALVPVDPEPRDGPTEFQAERLAWNRAFVREQAMHLLADNGDERDAWVLVPFLSGDNWKLRRAAAEVLAVIGGQKELDALNAWLALQHPNDPRVPKFRKLRDEFDARLKAKSMPRAF
jgi:hypothetical protein